MGSCLGIGGATRADDANVTMPLDETDVEQAGCGIVTDNNLSLFGFGMVRIRKNSGMRISEDGDCVSKGNLVLSLVVGGFALIPFELHGLESNEAPQLRLTTEKIPLRPGCCARRRPSAIQLRNGRRH
ncbi:hypothetical protein [Dokdonella sp.]|uniref:hypothetical protein n=2 Tax=Dokdonella sp. TaxID=2291710 RepID=UPI002DD63464|nr:hypothetical protein [Dokdonella sp.]